MMARIRTVKPEFWTDAAVGECSVSARLLLIGSLNFADDQGGLDRSAKQLKAQVFPYDVIDCEALIQELLTQGLFIEYEVDGKKYLHIRSFRKHQRVENPAKPRVPVYRSSPTPHLELTEDSPNPLLGVTVSSLEGNGRERNGKDLIRTTHTDTDTDTEPPGFLDFWRAYPKRAGDNPKGKARRAYRTRLTQGATPDEILRGTLRYANYLAANGSAGTQFVLQACTFVGPDTRFRDPWTPPAKPETATDRILRKNGADSHGLRSRDDIEPDPETDGSGSLALADRPIRR